MAHVGQESALGSVGSLSLQLRFAQLFGSLRDHRLQLTREKPLVTQQLRRRDGAAGPCRQAREEIKVSLAKRGAPLHSVEVETAHHCILGDHRNQGRLAHAPPFDMAALVRGQVGREVIRIDRDHDRAALVDNGLPGT